MLLSTEIEKFMDRQRGNLVDGLNTCMFAEVVKVDLKHMRVDVKLPLPDDPYVYQVPICPHQTGEFVIRPPYRDGDRVLIVFSQQDIDPILFAGGEPSKRQHVIDDATIIGGVTPFTEPLPAGFDAHEEDFVIAKRDFSAKIIIQKNNEILIESTNEVHVEGSRINLNCR